jgi:hypothetical protein
MKHALLVLLALPVFTHLPVAAQASDTVYVESTDVILFLHPETRIKDFLLCRLEDADDAMSAISFIGRASASGDANEQSTMRLLLGTIDKCNYRNNNCLVFFSPRTHDMFVDRPFRLPKRNELIFPVSRYPKRVDEGYTYCRVMIVPKSERTDRVIVKEFNHTIIPTVIRGAPNN